MSGENINESWPGMLFLFSPLVCFSTRVENKASVEPLTVSADGPTARSQAIPVGSNVVQPRRRGQKKEELIPDSAAVLINVTGQDMKISRQTQAVANVSKPAGSYVEAIEQ